MISKIKSSKIANVKYVFGILTLIALIVVFACEQKETIDIQEIEEESSTKLELSIVDEGRIKIDATAEELKKLKTVFFNNTLYKFELDENGDPYLVANTKLKKLNETEPVFRIVEEMPEFPGGDIALRKQIANTVIYPEKAIEKGISGKVYVSFVISKEGIVANAKVERGVDPLFDQEALRVVNELPKWKPGYQRGKAVNVQFTVPINFALQ